MKWMEALKQYNSGKAMWCIPKKGSPEYFDVRALMNYDTAKDIEARNVERREKSVAQLREATKNMKPGVRVDAPVKAKEPPKKAVEKKEVKSYFVDIEGYLDKLIKIYLVEGGIEGAKDNNVEEVYEKIKDNGDYVEYLTEALDYFGGEDEVAEKIWTYFTVKKKIPKKYVVSAMKSMREDGYSMFDDYIKK
jgi:hypothetical protein